MDFESITEQIRLEFQRFLSDARNFVDDIAWKEPFMISLMSFHLLTFIAIIATRKREKVQAFIFLTILGLVVLASRINAWAMINYKLFTKWKYFDDEGFFISMLFSAPLLVNSFVILINFLVQAFHLLVSVKTEQLKRSRAKKDKKLQ